MTCARHDLGVAQVIELIVRSPIGCVPIVEDHGRPIGIVTKLDLVEQLLANDRGETDSPSARSLAPATARELMTPHPIILGERTTIAQAAALMAAEDLHHVLVCDPSGRMVGIISTIDIVRWLAKNDGYIS